MCIHMLHVVAFIYTYVVCMYTYITVACALDAVLSTLYSYSDHYLIHTNHVGVDIEEALKTMALLGQRLTQAKADIQTSVSTYTHVYIQCNILYMKTVLFLYIVKAYNII